jgi:hypothetical protein
MAGDALYTSGHRLVGTPTHVALCCPDGSEARPPWAFLSHIDADPARRCPYCGWRIGQRLVGYPAPVELVRERLQDRPRT